MILQSRHWTTFPFFTRSTFVFTLSVDWRNDLTNGGRTKTQYRQYESSATHGAVEGYTLDALVDVGRGVTGKSAGFDDEGEV